MGGTKTAVGVAPTINFASRVLSASKAFGCPFCSIGAMSCFGVFFSFLKKSDTVNGATYNVVKRIGEGGRNL